VTHHFFTSPWLFDNFFKLGFLVTGIIMYNQVGMPSSLVAYTNVGSFKEIGCLYKCRQGACKHDRSNALFPSNICNSMI
jgi:hypothetical protein